MTNVADEIALFLYVHTWLYKWIIYYLKLTMWCFDNGKW